MDAWIDCLTYLDEDDGMSRFHLAKGEMLHIEISDTEDFNSRLPELCRYQEHQISPANEN